MARPTPRRARLRSTRLNAASFLELSEAAARQARRRIRARHPRRRAPAAPRRRVVTIVAVAVARARHRRQHRDLLARQQPACCARCRSRIRSSSRILTAATPTPRAESSWTYPIWEELHRRPQLFDSAFAWGAQRFNLANGGVAEFVDGIWATAGIFDTLGVSPRARARRSPTPTIGRGGGPDGPVAVISHAFWQRRFGGAADAIGTPADARADAVHDRRRHAAGFLRPRCRPPRSTSSCRSARSRSSAARSRRSTQRDCWWLSIMMRLQAGPIDRRGHRGAARRAAADPKRDAAARLAGDGSSEVSRREVHAGAGRAPATRRSGRGTNARCSPSWWSSSWSCSSRARTSRTCCSRARRRGGTNGACGWRSARRAGVSCGC